MKFQTSWTGTSRPTTQVLCLPHANRRKNVRGVAASSTDAQQKKAMSGSCTRRLNPGRPLALDCLSPVLLSRGVLSDPRNALSGIILPFPASLTASGGVRADHYFRTEPEGTSLSTSRVPRSCPLPGPTLPAASGPHRKAVLKRVTKPPARVFVTGPHRRSAWVKISGLGRQPPGECRTRRRKS